MVSIVELAISFFIQTPFPGRTSMRKVDIGRQGLRDILVLGELQSVVIGDGVDLVLRSIWIVTTPW